MIVGIRIINHLSLVAFACDIYFDFCRYDPCRYIKACQFFKDLLRFEALGKVAYRSAVIFEDLYCLFLIELKRDDVVRFKFSGKSSCDKGRGTAEGTECRCRILVGYDLGTS